MSILDFAQSEEIFLLSDDVDVEHTATDAPMGALPQSELQDPTEKHSTRCDGCGRPPGPVAVPGVSLFDLGVKHALNRLAKLIASVPGMSQGEANAIVLKLERQDVEL